ncbi:MAG TPA: response regulator [Anaeromyxobacteraceae bacterium]
MAELLEERVAVAGARPLVLVVNVEPRFGEAVSRFLEERAWHVQAAGDAREPLDRWALGPRLVVTDIDGTDMDCFELLQELSALEPRPGILVRVPQSAAALIDEALEDLGVDAVLERPCRLDDVEAALARVFRGRQP